MTDDLMHLADSGRLIDTGRTCIIHTAELPIYRCEVCGAEFDPADYEVIGRFHVEQSDSKEGGEAR